MLLTHIVARAGGGGSGGGGGGAGIIVLPIVVIGAIVAWWRRRKQIKRAEKAIEQARANDPSWDGVVERAQNIFVQFQQDWSDFSVPNMQTYLTPRYLQHITLMMRALKQMNRQNKMSNVQLQQATLFNVSDSSEDELDNFDIEMRASANDELMDLTTNSTLFVDAKAFTEVWNFEREGGQWMLDKISQVGIETSIEKGYTSKDDKKAKADEATKMRRFAEENNFFYNADFGWLLLPLRGLLFSLSSFGRSDVNYHVIGDYRNVLVQFYQYVPIIQDKRRFADYFKALYKPAYRYEAYMIAQAVLPKSYGNIVVRRKSPIGLFSFTPLGMTRVSLEGVDFDKDYFVYATDVEKATSLELLNPAYMEQLLAVPFKVSVEIVDNVLYLYSTDKKADFDIMLALLKNAFEEMKM